MVCSEAKVALQSFSGSLIIFASICLFNVYHQLEITDLTVNILIVALYFINIYFLLKFSYSECDFQIAIRAAFLGTIFALGIYVKLVAPSHIQIFGGYMAIMSLFHFTEFLAIAYVQPQQLSTDSFMINHSPEYIIAAMSSWLEFFVEAYFLPGLKELYWLSNFGICICLLGEVLRKTAILTAGSNFTHLVQSEKARGHVLVTHGVYSRFRHPSYVGWFYWSIGTQIILINPICVPAYALASWSFFNKRIFIEEITLLNFFGQQYFNYQEKVKTGIPLIEGYRI